MTARPPSNAPLHPRHHSRLSRRMRRQAFAFARMLDSLPCGSYTVMVVRDPLGFQFEPVAARAVEGKKDRNK